jgi:lipoic acid synthetase
VLVSITPHTPGIDRPKWLRAPAPAGENYRELKEIIGRLRLHTVCESAACPNVGECWNQRTATFMILGNVCTRRCGFCAVQKGAPLPVDYDEPARVAQAVEAMGLKFAVITSVNRDDREDGGAELFALVIRAIRERVPGCGVEVLIPDFQGSHAAVETVMRAAPDVLNHNTETVPRLYRQVRLGARYERSLDMLAYAGQVAPDVGTIRALRHDGPKRLHATAARLAACHQHLPRRGRLQPQFQLRPLRQPLPSGADGGRRSLLMEGRTQRRRAGSCRNDRQVHRGNVRLLEDPGLVDGRHNSRHQPSGRYR